MHGGTSVWRQATTRYRYPVNHNRQQRVCFTWCGLGVDQATEATTKLQYMCHRKPNASCTASHMLTKILPSLYCHAQAILDGALLELLPPLASLAPRSQACCAHLSSLCMLAVSACSARDTITVFLELLDNLVSDG